MKRDKMGRDTSEERRGKRGEREIMRRDREFKHVSKRKKKPPDELSQKDSEKNLRRTSYSFESSESYPSCQLFTGFEFDFSARGN